MERRFRMLMAVNVLLLVALLTVAATSRPRTLTVSELDVVDPHGVIRARIGGDLPDAVVNGKRMPRGQKAAGVILYDDSGPERGGYVTFSPSRNVALTLDNRSSAGQTAILVAGPAGGSALTLSYGNDLVEMRVDDETGPSIHAMKGKQVAFHVPPVVNFEATEGCRDFRSALTKMTRQEALDFCRARLSEEACQACIGPK